MSRYLAIMVFTGEAEGLEAFIDTLYDALRGDTEAQKRVHGDAPTIYALPSPDGEGEAS